ncbi:hypothetical protein BJP36_41610 [Moorena producens JHB]|uniref:Uncharacterized protein n=1 Tax=Moorena producens (strain JHB) TaxID=1454205 RepID=A0A9Q9SSK4_MOOP1|nr:hypothetical protein [Moorena producens]WAN68862.1 hypothetical protein BJP36_41610 [Moorena producens JHB]
MKQGAPGQFHHPKGFTCRKDPQHLRRYPTFHRSPPQTRQPTPARFGTIMAHKFWQEQWKTIRPEISWGQMRSHKMCCCRSSAFNGAQSQIDQWHHEWVSFESKFEQNKKPRMVFTRPNPNLL